ncbi:hypothetical protein OAU50_01425 [Planctomycetota bacterium]|nr:hypothetical protein [Planctomycetota bacterium]
MRNAFCRVVMYSLAIVLPACTSVEVIQVSSGAAANDVRVSGQLSAETEPEYDGWFDRWGRDDDWYLRMGWVPEPSSKLEEYGLTDGSAGVRFVEPYDDPNDWSYNPELRETEMGPH